MSEQVGNPPTTSSNGSRISSKRSRSSTTIVPRDASSSSSSAMNHSDNAGSTTTVTTTTTTMTAATTSLSTFLHRDIQPEGHRILLPFLTTTDLLRLSECSQGLIKYRYHLSRVTIVSHPSPTPSMKRALVRLLLDQEEGGGGLEYLRVEDRSVLHVLDLASWGCFEGLKTLDLSDIGLEEEGASYVERALMGGGLKSLEELNLLNHQLSDGCLKRMMGALRDGACPRLRILNLHWDFDSTDDEDDDEDEEGIGQAMAKAFQSGHCRDLQELNLSGNKLGSVGATAMIRALQEGSCPHLTKLYLTDCGVSTAHGQALGLALRSMACPNLQELGYFFGWDMEEEGYVAIFEAMEAGGCPNMKSLDLSSIPAGLTGATALAHALSSGKLWRLQNLDLSSAFDGEASSILPVLEVMKRVAFPNLLRLTLSRLEMTPDHGRVLGDAIGGGSFPKLEELDVSHNDTLGDEGVMHVMAGLEVGGCPNLKELETRGIAIGPDGGQALARALASGNLSNLRALNFGDPVWYARQVMIGDHVMAEIIKGLRYCPQLVEFDLSNTGMGQEAGQALLQTLREGSWTQLYEIDVSDNPDLGDDMIGVGLAEVLEEGSFPWLARLCINNTGMTREGVERFLSLIEKEEVCPKLCNLVVNKCWVGEVWEERMKSCGIRVSGR